MVKGSPTALLAVLARHRVTHLVLPEPDLEDAFLSYYAEDAEAELDDARRELAQLGQHEAEDDCARRERAQRT